MNNTRRKTNAATKTGGAGTGTWRFDFTQEVKEELGVDYVEVDFQDNPTNLVGVFIEFLFSEPAATFVSGGSLLLCDSVFVEGLSQDDGVNGVGAGAGGAILFSSDEEYNSFVAEFLGDKRISFITTY
jgi:hypothetical protein